MATLRPGDPPAELSRRGFLRGFAATCAASVCPHALLGCGGPVAAAAARTIALPPAVDGKIVVPVADIPELSAVGGWVIGTSTGLQEPCIVVRSEAGRIDVASARCTHAGCNVAFNGLNYTLDCPCHGSSFELDGQVVSGPATLPLRAFRTEFDGATLLIATG